VAKPLIIRRNPKAPSRCMGRRTRVRTGFHNSAMNTPTLPDSLCYLDGVYGPLGEARVSVLDRGFIFGDGVYEVLPVYGGRIFRFGEHMDRLDRSLGELRIANPHTRDEWLAIARRL